MLAQRQPSFKERVIAHWSSDSAPKMIGTKSETEDADIIYYVVEERCMRSEAETEVEVDFIQVTMQA